jgi:hypothetical protein
MNKKKLVTIVILLITIVLAMLAAYTAFKLYNIGKAPTAEPSLQPSPTPTATERVPEVFQQDEMPCQISFTVSPQDQCTSPGEITVTENDPGESNITVGASIGYTNVEIRVTDTNGQETCYQSPDICNGNYSYNWCWVINISPSQIQKVEFYVSVLEFCTNGELCGNWLPVASPSPSPSQSPSPSPLSSPSQSPQASPSPSPSPSPSASPPPSPSPSPSPEPTPPPECWDTCTSDSQCSSSLKCQSVSGTFRCVNPSCPEESDCICPAAPAEELPTAGITAPTFILAIGGILLIALGLLL